MRRLSKKKARQHFAGLLYPACGYVDKMTDLHHPYRLTGIGRACRQPPGNRAAQTPRIHWEMSGLGDTSTSTQEPVLVCARPCPIFGNSRDFLPNAVLVSNILNTEEELAQSRKDRKAF